MEAYFCRDKHVFVATKHVFVATNVSLARQKFGREKILFVARKIYLLSLIHI